MDLIEIKGKINTAICYARVVVQPQIFTLLVINQRQEEQDLNRTLMLKTLIVL